MSSHISTTGANGARSIEARLARCKRYNLSPFPRKTRDQKRHDRANRSRKL